MGSTTIAYKGNYQNIDQNFVFCFKQYIGELKYMFIKIRSRMPPLIGGDGF